MVNDTWSLGGANGAGGCAWVRGCGCGSRLFDFLERGMFPDRGLFSLGFVAPGLFGDAGGCWRLFRTFASCAAPLSASARARRTCARYHERLLSVQYLDPDQFRSILASPGLGFSGVV